MEKQRRVIEEKLCNYMSNNYFCRTGNMMYISNSTYSAN